MSSAAVDKISPGNTAGIKDIIYKIFHNQLQVQRPGSQGSECTGGNYIVYEILYA